MGSDRSDVGKKKSAAKNGNRTLKPDRSKAFHNGLHECPGKQNVSVRSDTLWFGITTYADG